MAQYTLVLDVGDAGLRHLSRARRRVVFAKPSGNRPPNVAWLAGDPAANTTVSWDDAYGLYAARVPVRDGAAISVVAAVHPAADGAIYPFAGTRFGKPVAEARVPRGHYDVRNDQTVAVTFGLLQSATIDGRVVRAPLNAVVVPPGFTADFIAATTVYVWTQAGVDGGSIVSQVPPDAAIVALDAAHPSRRLRYEDSTGTFVAVGGDATWFSRARARRKDGDES